MSISTLTPNARRRAAWSVSPARRWLATKVGAALARLRGRFRSAGYPARVPALQLEHLFAYAAESETAPEAGE